MNINAQQFQQLAAEGYNRIPVVQEILADLDTPLSVYLKLACGERSFLLESVQGGEKWGRYSIIGLPARYSIQVWGEEIRLFEQNSLRETHQQRDVLGWIERYQQQFHVPTLPGMPRFTGGLVGFFGYDAVRYIEPTLKPGQPPDTVGSPDIELLLAEEVVVFDNLSGKLFFIVHADPSQAGAYERATLRLEELVHKLRAPCPSRTPNIQQEIQESDFISSFPRAEYMQAVERIKDYIVEGDVMQVVLAQRLSVPLTVAPLDVYRALRCLNPSPYLFFLDLAHYQIVGSSPEILVRLQQGEVTVRPLAGTRPRGKNEAEDLALETELLADPKELAEHLMLIDLGRNDVGKVAEIGSVRVSDQMSVERYSHVMHIVSNVTARLASDKTPMDALQACFPAGTLSGAPKIRAMEIIDELEPVKRGIYGGAVGYLTWNGEMDVAIAIRTAVLKNGQLHIQAGAGIVADSVPEKEWEETMNKARAVISALRMATAGLG